MIKDGKIWFEAGLDNSKLHSDVQKSVEEFRQLGGAAEREGEKMENTFKRVGAAAASFFTLREAAQFYTNMAKVRGDFQNLEISFETMLRSRQKSNDLMLQMIETAAKTPFGLQEVASGAKQLLAYGSAVENVNEELIMLGNIASGLSIPLNDLIYLYGTTQTQGRLFTIDMRQFMGRGIPMAKELAKELGKTEEEISSMVTAGQIGFDKVQKALKTMTSEGGMFFNLMEKKSKSIPGLYSNLEDAVSKMLNDMGRTQEGVITDTLQGAIAMTENYEQVGKSIMAVVGVLGAYKAAVMVANVVLKEQAAANAMVAASNGVFSKSLAYQWVWTERLQKMQALLNKTMLNNPYVILATVVAGAAIALWALRDSTTAAEKAQKRINDVMEEQKKKTEELKTSSNSLLNVLSDQTSTSFERVRALNELKQLYPSIFEKYDIESIKLVKLIELQKELNEAIGQRTRNENKNNLSKAEEEVKRLEGQVENARNNPLLFLQYGPTTYLEVQKSLKRQLDIARETVKGYQKIVSSDANNLWEATNPKEVKIFSLDKNIELVKNQIKELEELVEKGDWSKTLELSQKRLKLDNLVKERESYGVTEKQIKKNKSYWEKVRDEAQVALEGLDDALEGTKEWLALEKTILDAQDKIDRYDAKKGKGKDKTELKTAQDKADTIERIRKQAQERENAEIEAGLQLQQAVLDLEEDTYEKRRKQAELNHHKDLFEVTRMGQELVKKQQETERAEWEKNGSKGVFTPKTTTASQLPEGPLKTLSTFMTAMTTKYDKEQGELLKELLDKYQDYAERRLEIEKEYDRDVRNLEESRNEKNDAQITQKIAKATKDKTKKLKDVDFEEFKDDAKYKKLFSNLEEYGTKTLKDLLKWANEVNVKAFNPENAKEYMDAIERLTDLVETRNPFTSLSTNFKSLLKGLKMKKGQTVLADDGETELTKQDVITKAMGNIASVTSKLTQDLDKLAGGIGDIFGDEAGYAAEQVAKLAGAVSGFAQGASKLMQGDIVGGISDVVSSIGSVFRMGREVKEMNRLAREENQKFYDAAFMGEKEYMSLLRERLRTEQQIGEIALDYQQRITEELKKQKGEVSSDYDTIMALLQKEEYITGKGYRHGTWFRKAKTWDIKESLAGKTYDEIEQMYMEGRLEEKAKSLFEQLRALKEEGQDIESMLLEEAQSFKDALSGITFDSARDSLKSMLEDGRVDITETGEFMKKTFRDAIISSVQTKILDSKLNALIAEFQTSVEQGTFAEKFDYFNTQMGAIADLANKELDALKSIPNIGKLFTDAAKQTASSSGFQSMSQDTGNELNGRFTDLQIKAGNIEKISARLEAFAEQINIKITVTAEKLTEMRDIALESMSQLQDINKNTRQLYEINEKLTKIDKNTQNW